LFIYLFVTFKKTTRSVAFIASHARIISE